MIYIKKARVREYPGLNDCVVEYQIYPQALTWSVYIRTATKREAEIIVAKIYLGLNSMFKIGD